jgi:AraC-like DNA-binding protein
MNPQLAAPLDSFPAVHSSDPAEIEHALVGVFGARRLSLPGRNADLAVRANHWQSDNISLSYCSYGGNADVEFPEAGFYRQLFSLRGDLAIKIDGTPQQVSLAHTPVVRAGASLFNNFTAGYEQLVLRISTSALTWKLAAMLGAPPRIALEFEPAAPRCAVEGLRRFLLYMVGELDRTEGNLGSLIVTEFEHAIMTSFLCSNPSNYTALLNAPPKSVGSWQVRRAEEYIEAHWQEPLSIRTLAHATSTSARSLFFHFRESRGKTPMEFVKEVRLSHARRLLSEGNTSVTEIALTCGFGNLGHFAKDYLQRFGERPSETLKRAKFLLA